MDLNSTCPIPMNDFAIALERVIECARLSKIEEVKSSRFKPIKYKKKIVFDDKIKASIITMKWHKENIISWRNIEDDKCVELIWKRFICYIDFLKEAKSLILLSNNSYPILEAVGSVEDDGRRVKIGYSTNNAFAMMIEAEISDISIGDDSTDLDFILSDEKYRDSNILVTHRLLSFANGESPIKHSISGMVKIENISTNPVIIHNGYPILFPDHIRNNFIFSSVMDTIALEMCKSIDFILKTAILKYLPYYEYDFSEDKRNWEEILTDGLFIY